ncbi:ThiF family adenylyltransferase [Burkholderia sp. 9120]|uniref:ThiF family adenylyltransferase n=1 Tax=Burkholderia sp. 9120 TaxID=1500897 RepID=UPI0005558FF3|nr:ThiF family adenylyltransferase [Burkholderia sp. 9120]
MRTRIVLLEQHEQELRSILFDQPGIEGAAFVLCGEASTGETLKLVAHSVVAIPPGDFLERKHDRLSIRSAALTRVAKLARHEGLSVVFVHSHPGGFAEFSKQDDAEEEKFIPFFQSRVPGKLHGTLVMTQDALVGRIYAECRHDVEQIVVVGQRFRLYTRGGINDFALFDRQVRAFGPEIQLALSGLVVGIVGLGGTGSACAEQLARLGVGTLVLFDHDTLSKTNLNRVYGATLKDVGKNKAVIAKNRLDAIGLDTGVEAIPDSIEEQTVAKRLRDCDVVFGCTDRELPRAILSKLATAYHIPLIDMGVVIDSHGGIIQGVYGRATTVLAGEPCLLCRGRISAEGLRVEGLSDSDRDRQVQQGYAPELATPAPAVIAFTTMVASHAVTELLHRLTGFMGASRQSTEVLLFIDKGRIAANRRNPEEGCFCEDVAEWGRGDEAPYLGMVWRLMPR